MTTVGPGIMIEAMTQGRPRFMDATQLGALDGMDEAAVYSSSTLPSPQASPRPNMPLPNPPFVFPAPSPSGRILSSRGTGRRPQSVIEFSTKDINAANARNSRPRGSPALPDFSFNPGAALSPTSFAESPLLSPPHSPGSIPSPLPALAPMPISRGHRRGGSEFVGGSIRGGDTITVLASGSPTRSENGATAPSFLSAGPPRRPRHGHVRSVGMTSLELQSLGLPVSGPMRGSSAPTSPAAFDGFSFPDAANRSSQSEPSLTPVVDSQGDAIASSSTQSPEIRVEEPPKPVGPRPKGVGFSDTLEIIPRPLSVISSDTSSTTTTRPGHSVSGSISSVVSANTDRESGPRAKPTLVPKDTERPSTAGAVLERTESSMGQEQADPAPQRRRSIPYMAPFQSLPSFGPPSPSPSKTAKRWSFFGLDPFVSSSSPTRSRRLSSSSSESPKSRGLDSPASSSQRVSETSLKAPEPLVPDDEITSGKKSKKPKKVKSWAGSILSRRPKSRGKKKRRAPTPPIRETHSDGDEPNEVHGDMAFEPEMPSLMVTETVTVGNVETWSSPRPVSVPDEDSFFPMIDLDAALGPFNTPLPRNPEWDTATRAGGSTKKQLHSAAGMSRFVGPGMHYTVDHRRTGSAPEMTPFDPGRYGIHRFGSTSTMADVFEEEEEEDLTPNATPDASTSTVTTPAVEEAEDAMTTSAREDAGEESAERQNSIPSLRITKGPSECGIEGERQVAEMPVAGSFVKPHHEAGIGEGRNDSRVEHPAALWQVTKGKEVAPFNPASTPIPSSSASLSQVSPNLSSSFPAPSPPIIYYDARRVSTAASSVTTEVTAENIEFLLLGEPGPELRNSLDIPSLASSNSTTTRENGLGQNPQARPNPLIGQERPVSLTSTAFGRRRSSLASISRFINSAHGERSKLSMEVPLEQDDEKKVKDSKAKRLSRRLQFWKSKENLQST